MLFTSVLLSTYCLSLVATCLLYILVWIAFPGIEKYRKLSTLAIIVVSVVLCFHYSKQDYNPGKHYKTVAEYLNEQKHDSQAQQ